jgi:hypothetical protein
MAQLHYSKNHIKLLCLKRKKIVFLKLTYLALILTQYKNAFLLNDVMLGAVMINVVALDNPTRNSLIKPVWYALSFDWALFKHGARYHFTPSMEGE